MRTAVLFGPPNTGKSTLFNSLTTKHSNAVNYPGSTVDIYMAPLKLHPSLMLIDAPGIQSLVPQSPEEHLALTTITQLNQRIDADHNIPDLIVCIADITQADRHVAMAKRLIDDGYPVILVLTMLDEAIKQGIDIDTKKLSTALGVQVFKCNAKAPECLKELVECMAQSSGPCGRIIQPKNVHIDDMVTAYEWSRATIRQCQVERQRKATVDLDAWLLHPVAGYFIFLLVMGGLFCFLFYVSAPFMDAIDASFSLLGRVVAPWLPNSLQNFVVNGLLSGVAGVMVFVPQIAMLFFGLGIMESSGFLARSAVLIDHPFRKVGLNGRSFVPLLSGCACAVPAILATRVIPNQRVRRLTMAIIPLMQCSARLPVYGLLLSTLFTSSLAKAMALTGIYVISIFISAVVLAVANRWVPSSRNADAPFIIELPKWRWPDFQGLVRDTFRKTSKFLVGAGPIILGISLGLWGMAEIQINNQPLIYILGHFISPIVQPMGVDWRVGVAILLSFAAREVFVSALAIVHHMSSQSLADSVASTHGLFTPASAVGLVLFFMVAMQCGATVVVLKNEMKSLRWPILILVAYICLAYALAVLANMVL